MAIGDLPRSAEGDDCESGALARRQPGRGDDLLNDPALVSELIEAGLQCGRRRPAIVAFIGDKAQRARFRVPPAYMKRRKLFRHGTSNLFDVN